MKKYTLSSETINPPLSGTLQEIIKELNDILDVDWIDGFGNSTLLEVTYNEKTKEVEFNEVYFWDIFDVVITENLNHKK